MTLILHPRIRRKTSQSLKLREANRKLNHLQNLRRQKVYPLQNLRRQKVCPLQNLKKRKVKNRRRAAHKNLQKVKVLRNRRSLLKASHQVRASQ